MSLELTEQHMGSSSGVLPQIPRLVYSVTFVFCIFLLLLCSKSQRSPRQKRENDFFGPPGGKANSPGKKSVTDECI